MQQVASSDKSIINAQPTKDLFISILVRDVTIRDAIGDLVDNSVDGALKLRPDRNYEGLNIEIKLDPQSNSFMIADNCGGIPVDVARNYAFCFGRPEGAEDTGHSVGVFGIGMKRALFRLGKKFKVKSVAKDSSFTVEVDVEKWRKGIDQLTSEELDANQQENERKDDMRNWQFRFKEYEEDLEEDFPEEQRGTIITVELHDDVREAFESEIEQGLLISELQREHLFNIDRGIRIKVNDTLLEAKQLKLLASDDFKTAYWEDLDGPVKVKIYAGISEKDSTNGGWYVFCNDRLVLGPDQTKDTGWGVKSPTRIPEYHSQFYRFRGYAFLEADDPRDLPWNTAKTGMNMDSPVYRAVLQQMITLMRTVIDFLNQLHDEAGHFNNERINEKPLEDAVENARVVPLSTVRTLPVHLNLEIFVAPEPAKPPKPLPTQVWIRYAVSTARFRLVEEYLEVDKPGEIGQITFDYFYAREIES